jgi:hypothetical protein
MFMLKLNHSLHYFKTAAERWTRKISFLPQTHADERRQVQGNEMQIKKTKPFFCHGRTRTTAFIFSSDIPVCGCLRVSAANSVFSLSSQKIFCPCQSVWVCGQPQPFSFKPKDQLSADVCVGLRLIQIF